MALVMAVASESSTLRGTGADQAFNARMLRSRIITAASCSIAFAVILTVTLALPIAELDEASGRTAVDAVWMVAAVAAPIAYLLFAVGSWNACRRSLLASVAGTLRALGLGLLPWITLTMGGLVAVPELSRSLLIAAALSVPVAIAWVVAELPTVPRAASTTR